jgi:hypothetical protein
MRLYPKVQKLRNSIFLYLHRYNHGKHKTEMLKIGESVVVEGGPSTGKSSFLQKTIKQLEAAGEKCIFINATLPAGDWVKEYKLFGKNLESRLDLFMKSLPEKFYLIIDNAERLQDSRKLEVALYLFEKSRSTIVGCTRYALLNPKLKVRLSKAKIHSLGSGTDTFDITYFILAIMIVFVALIGAHNLIFLAAAFRYMFQGTRIGGKKS